MIISRIASRLMINTLINQRIGTLVIGENSEWKQEINLGKKNNQNFVQIPHAKLIEMLSYKAEMAGINVILTEESYTSKASFMDNDLIPMYKRGEKNLSTFSGKRVKRGLYRTASGRLVNADVNGSLNQCEKSSPKCFWLWDRGASALGGFPDLKQLAWCCSASFPGECCANGGAFLRNATQTLTPSSGNTDKIRICHI